jgi:Tfp pilus assembly protein FimT
MKETGMRTGSKNHKSAWRGFSLVEMIVIVVIIGVMALVAGPAMSTVVRHNRVNRATTIITSDLQNAFAVAARQREPVRITGDATTRSYQFTDRKSGAVLRIRSFYGSTSEYGLNVLTFSPTTIDVFPNGVSSLPLTVDLANGDYSKQIKVSTAGFVRVAR